MMKKITLAALTGAIALSLSGCQVLDAANPFRQQAVQTAPEPEVTPDNPMNDKIQAMKNALTALPDRIQDQQVYVDAMTKAGFDTSTIQVTQVNTPTGEAPDSVQVAGQFEGQCIVSDATKGKVNPVVLPLSINGCFVASAQ